MRGGFQLPVLVLGVAGSSREEAAFGASAEAAGRAVNQESGWNFRFRLQNSGPREPELRSRMEHGDSGWEPWRHRSSWNQRAECRCQGGLVMGKVDILGMGKRKKIKGLT